MRKKLIALLLAAVMLVSVFAACGGENNSSTAGGDSSASTPESSTGGDSSESAPESSQVSTGDGAMTEVGTPRSETLIVEFQSATDCPGQFNTYMNGTSAGIGIHQLMSAMMWEMDTVKGEQFPEVAADMGTPNEDFTEWTIKIREGIKWSDGEDLNAEDVAFTMNMIKDTDSIGASSYYKQVFKSIEAVDATTVKIVTNEPFPRLTQRFGVTIWGNDLRIVPEHIYSQQADVYTFKDEQPVVAGPYTVHSYDPNGTWVLYQRREDWEQSTLGVVNKEVYGVTDAPPAWVWMRTLGDDESTKQMAMINNEIDVLCEVTPEVLEAMMAQNDKVKAWYADFPYATSDDPCSKGLVFSMGKGAPYNDPNFRWGMTLMLDFDQISMNVFEGIGRASCFPILTATTAMTELYYQPLKEWVTDFELDLGDGTKFKPFDPEYKNRMAETLRAQGRDIPTDEATLEDMFGIGCWKHDEEAATKLLAKAGVTKEGDTWMFNGEPFKFNVSYLSSGEFQAGRGGQAAYNQWKALGFDCTLVSESSATWDTNGGTGEFDIGAYWPTGGITKDIYSQISGYDNALIKPLGETGSGQGMRWDNEEASKIIQDLSKISPDSDEAYQLAQDFMKIAIEDCVMIGFHSGVKFVPTNDTYWTGYPCADDPYNGPWWWWSCFKYILPHLKAVG